MRRPAAAARSAAQASGVAHTGAHALGAAAYAARAVELGEDPAGPLGTGLLTFGALARTIDEIRTELAAT